jgi:hypothetical protein
MENLENEQSVATEIPTEQESDNSENVEKELSDDEIKEEIKKIEDEIKEETDPKEKRHKEQDKGWKMKILKERERAKTLEEENNRKADTLKNLENSLIEEAYSKVIDERF